MNVDPQMAKGWKQEEEEEKDCPDEAKVPGEGRPCPPPAMMCEYMNDYMCWWHEWALQVHKQLWPGGNTDDPDPPPWPPFKTS